MVDPRQRQTLPPERWDAVRRTSNADPPSWWPSTGARHGRHPAMSDLSEAGRAVVDRRSGGDLRAQEQGDLPRPGHGRSQPALGEPGVENYVHANVETRRSVRWRGRPPGVPARRLNYPSLARRSAASARPISSRHLRPRQAQGDGHRPARPGAPGGDRRRRHVASAFAVVGTTGVGKSTSVAILLRAALAERPTCAWSFSTRTTNIPARRSARRPRRSRQFELRWLFRFEEFLEVVIARGCARRRSGLPAREGDRRGARFSNGAARGLLVKKTLPRRGTFAPDARVRTGLPMCWRISKPRSALEPRIYALCALQSENAPEASIAIQPSASCSARRRSRRSIRIS